jgi:ketosteroid isomerase-like protein
MTDATTPGAATTLTRERAETLLADYQRQWNTGDVETYLQGFTDDVAVTFADLPPMRGKAALKDFIEARLARQHGYQLDKTLRGVLGNTIVCTWTARWTDAVTEKAMQGRGIELIEINGDDKCASWDAAFNAWPEHEPVSSLFI